MSRTELIIAVFRNDDTALDPTPMIDFCGDLTEALQFHERDIEVAWNTLGIFHYAHIVCSKIMLDEVEVWCVGWWRTPDGSGVEYEVQTFHHSDAFDWKAEMNEYVRDSRGRTARKGGE